MHETTDTSTEAEEVQLALLRAMSGRDRVRQTCVLSSHLRQMALNAIRKRFPEMDDSENKLAFIELTFGKSLSDAIRSQVTGASR
ncbi:MAG: hypothetical protein KGQ51_09105 [Planctomycetes bacterium]|nr:hypothetical protein [Planctomycetota bacterium]